MRHFQCGPVVLKWGPQCKIWVSPEGMPKCFLLTLRCTNNNDHHFE